MRKRRPGVSYSTILLTSRQVRFLIGTFAVIWRQICLWIESCGCAGFTLFLQPPASKEVTLSSQWWQRCVSSLSTHPSLSFRVCDSLVVELEVHSRTDLGHPTTCSSAPRKSSGCSLCTQTMNQESWGLFQEESKIAKMSKEKNYCTEADSGFCLVFFLLCFPESLLRDHCVNFLWSTFLVLPNARPREEEVGSKYAKKKWLKKSHVYETSLKSDNHIRPWGRVPTRIYRDSCLTFAATKGVWLWLLTDTQHPLWQMALGRGFTRNHLAILFLLWSLSLFFCFFFLLLS